MAPLRGKKKVSASSASSAGADLADFPAPPTRIATKTGSPARTRTPIRSPSKRAMTITQAQKQALIDNLQLEVTERARKLRAQYSLQAQGLRSRIEIRINRIPIALRKANMGELLVKYAEAAQADTNGASSRSKSAENANEKAIMSGALPEKEDATVTSKKMPPPPRTRGMKRSSDHLEDANKENAQNELSMPKKRTKTAANPPAPKRAASKAKLPHSEILSPKNSNSQTLPRSPFKAAGSPERMAVPRPAPSPVKASGSVNAAAAATKALAGVAGKAARTTRTTTRKAAPAAPAPATTATARGKRATHAAPAKETKTTNRTASNSSQTSTSSTGTTVVAKTRKAPALKKAPSTAAARKTAAGGAAAKKAASAAAKPDPQPTGRRVLRKRT
ncbi:MAG: hypothetical protein M1819_004956 [Sarea resinae]|nr:MAG: hypothetical protein M1819_004956 [Sarea resinae]